MECSGDYHLYQVIKISVPSERRNWHYVLLIRCTEKSTSLSGSPTKMNNLHPVLKQADNCKSKVISQYNWLLLFKMPKLWGPRKAKYCSRSEEKKEINTMRDSVLPPRSKEKKKMPQKTSWEQFVKAEYRLHIRQGYDISIRQQYCVYVKFLQRDNGLVVIKENVLVLRGV